MSESQDRQYRQSFAEKPYIFLQNNVVVIGIDSFSVAASDADQTTGILIRNASSFLTQVTVYRQERATVQGTGGSAFTLLMADDSVSKDEKRSAYFVPFFLNTTCGTMLGGNAKVMFTPRMDGCSFGIGSQAGDDNVLVMHSNSIAAGKSYGSVTGEAIEQMSKIQNAILKSAFLSQKNQLTASIAPNVYMRLGDEIPMGTDKVFSTTFGTLDGGRWSFFSLRYRRIGGGGGAPVYSHLGVHPA